MQLPAGVHQRGRVGQELQVGHHRVELLFHHLPELIVGPIPEFGLRQVPRYPLEHPLGGFRHLALLVLCQVTPFQHRPRVFAQPPFSRSGVPHCLGDPSPVVQGLVFHRSLSCFPGFSSLGFPLFRSSEIRAPQGWLGSDAGWREHESCPVVPSPRGRPLPLNSMVSASHPWGFSKSPSRQA